MKREPFERDASTPTRFDRRLYTPDLYPDQKGDPWWLRLTYDEDDGNVVIELGAATSESPAAQTLVTAGGKEVQLSEDEAKWLHARLGELLARLEVIDADSHARLRPESREK